MARGRQKDQQIRNLLERNSNIIDHIYENEQLKGEVERLRAAVAAAEAHAASGQTVWFQHEVYFSGIRFEAGEYRLVRIGDHPSDPNF